eukprot:Amastigsp_a342112_80.p1 type:complete len:532 gc:universal Amastigsp_a342112_80:1657-62(-)
MSTPPLQPMVMRRAPRFPNINRYKRDRVLGKGNFGKVCLAHSPSGSEYAIKEMVVRDKMRSQTDRAIWEVRLASQVGRGHPFIVSYKEATVHNGVVYIVMEFATGGNLKSLISQYSSSSGALPESLVRKYFLQLALALKTVHDSFIIHRDLKTENVFLDSEGNVKLGDFGLARTVHHSQLAYTSAGTPGYIAPEILMGHPYDFKADVWSLGCIVYEMCAGVLPYHPSHRAGIVYQQHAPLSSHYSAELGALVNRMLDKVCHTRPSIAQLLDSAYLRSALVTDLSPEHRACFDSAGGLIHASDAHHSHADDIQSHLVGTIRAFDFSEDTYADSVPFAASSSGAKRGSGHSASEDSNISELAESESLGDGIHRLSPNALGAGKAPAAAAGSADGHVDALALKMAALKKQFESMAGDLPGPAETSAASSPSVSPHTSSVSVSSASTLPMTAMTPVTSAAVTPTTSTIEYQYLAAPDTSSMWQPASGPGTAYWTPSSSAIGSASGFGSSLVIPYAAAPAFRPFGLQDARSTAFYF